MHTRLYAGSPLKQDSFERAQALGLEGKTGKMGGTERAKQHASFSARSLPVKRNGTEMERFLTPTVCTIYSTRQKKVAYTVYRFSVFRVIPFYRFTVPFTVLPSRFAVLPFQVQTIERAGCTESGDSGRVSRGPKAWEVQRDNFNGRHACGAVRGTAHPCERTFRGNACCQMVRQVAAWCAAVP